MKPERTRREAGAADRAGDRSPDSFGQNAPGESGGGLFDLLFQLLGGLWDRAEPGVADAIADIRKRFEESWFGREVSPSQVELTVPPSFQELMRAQQQMLPQHHQPERDSPDQAQSGPDR